MNSSVELRRFSQLADVTTTKSSINVPPQWKTFCWNPKSFSNLEKISTFHGNSPLSESLMSISCDVLDCRTPQSACNQPVIGSSVVVVVVVVLVGSLVFGFVVVVLVRVVVVVDDVAVFVVVITGLAEV